MKYENIVKSKFKSRPNRFIAHVDVECITQKAHVKNTGRLKELLMPGATVYLQDHISSMGNRKLRYSLIAVQKAGEVVNIDSQAPNKVAHEALLDGRIMLPEMDCLKTIRPETKYGNSRFDFYVEDTSGKKGYIEIKGCTLNDNGIGRFPDAPSERAVKHVNELIELRKKGYMTYIIFICAMKGIVSFSPNEKTHPEFKDALSLAASSGVRILCFDCTVTEDSIEVDSEILVNI